MRKVNPDAKKAMKMMYSEHITLGEAWRRVKGSRRLRSVKRSKRRLSKAKNSLKLNRKKSLNLLMVIKSDNIFMWAMFPK